MSSFLESTMQVRVEGKLVDRKIASITRSITTEGELNEYPEPLLGDDEVVFRPDDDPAPIIVQRTIPA